MVGSVVLSAVAEAAFVTPSVAFCKRLDQVVVRPKRARSTAARARVAQNREMQARANRSRALYSGRTSKRLRKANLPSTREYCASPQPVYRPIIKGCPLN